MATSLTTGLYMVMSVTSKTLWTMGGVAADINPVVGSTGPIPPQGLNPLNLWTIQPASDPNYWTMWNAYHPNYAYLGSSAQGYNVQMASPDGSDKQMWNITHHHTFQGPTYYTIVNKATQTTAELQNGATADGTPIQGKTGVSGNANQAWILIPCPQLDN